MAKQTILHTRDYDQFVFLSTNRDVGSGHVETLKKEFEESGNMTQKDPVLVNEKMEIIDGQHRVEACRILGEPVYYMVVPGLTVRDARKMNILHKGWGPADYAKSYANSGDLNYIIYEQLKEEYEVPHKLLIIAVNGGEKTGMKDSNIFSQFRNGDMVVRDIAKAKELLEILISVREMTGISNSAFYVALFKVSRAEGYDHKHMLRKMAQFGDRLYRPFATAEDNLRLLEEIYNYAQAQGHRLRLY